MHHYLPESYFSILEILHSGRLLIIDYLFYVFMFLKSVRAQKLSGGKYHVSIVEMLHSDRLSIFDYLFLIFVFLKPVRVQKLSCGIRQWFKSPDFFLDFLKFSFLSKHSLCNSSFTQNSFFYIILLCYRSILRKTLSFFHREKNYEVITLWRVPSKKQFIILKAKLLKDPNSQKIQNPFVSVLPMPEFSVGSL